MTVLVVVEHDRGTIAPATHEAMTAARELGAEVHALTIGADADGLADDLGPFGATSVLQAHHDVLDDYGPEAWGATVAAAVAEVQPSVVVATGTDRGNEVMAHAAACLDLPLAANCTAVAPGEPAVVTRVRWGGSLLEEATLTSSVLLVTTAHHAFEPATPHASGSAIATTFRPDLDPNLQRSVVRERVERAAGVTLSTAPVVVGGGRGVGSADGFAPLEDLAALLGGVVGCSRVVTNNGWRSHRDQVGQTGTRIAPTLYMACGISGAIQHWVGAMGAKHILAINTDPAANMVSKADYAVIGDLHEVIPAITEEIRRRQA